MTGEELVVLQAEAINQIPKEKVIESIPEYKYGLEGIIIFNNVFLIFLWEIVEKLIYNL